jgi:hypothetical protein
MKIAFFSESNFEGKIPRNFENMRTEYAWYVALDSTHHSIGNLPAVADKVYDLGIVIIPKNNIEELMLFPMIEQMKRVCKKIGFMQEGPYWYFQDYPMEQQIWFYNTLMEIDVLFCHNEVDVDYFKGITGKKQVYKMPSLMITDYIKPSKEKLESVIIGGNMVRWYGGLDSYIVAQEFDMPIVAPSMGRKIDREDEMDIQHLPYMTWVEWMNNLSQYHVGVHMMPTHAAGTFTLNCAFHGIPCIGYKGLDTQEELHPLLSVNVGDMAEAIRLARRLKDGQFYEECSIMCRENYEKSLYTEERCTEYLSLILEDLK